ncbi:hypothetical protein M3182_03275 [Mesobacillus maritimus]|nr:hypothetical protein [Mesobacillus maritimus]MCM3584766.1 hypothetical protein [Mesobacillus maritimus]MCM3671868.1 hypothetical protein [Mesobacillus maritimus]
MENKNANSPKEIQYSIWDTRTKEMPKAPTIKKDIDRVTMASDIEDKNE